MAKLIIRSTAPILPALPQSEPDTSLPTGWDGAADATVGGGTDLENGADFQTALDNANQVNDPQGIYIIEINAGVVCATTTSFELPDANSGTDWLIIRTSQHSGTLPAAGSRITEDHIGFVGRHTGADGQAVLTDSEAYGEVGWSDDVLIGRTVINETKAESATITDNDSTTVTGVLSGSADWDTGDYYRITTPTMATLKSTGLDKPVIRHLGRSIKNIRFVGIEFWDNNHTASMNYGMIRIGWTAAEDPDDPFDGIVFDRCHIHGDPDSNHYDGILAGGDYGGSLAVVDSRIEHIQTYIGTECHAINLYGSMGPGLIENNYLSGSGMSVLTGGHSLNAYAKEDSVVDLTIRGNYSYKLTAWRTAISGGPNNGEIANVKNHFETKEGFRVLVEGNSMHQCWPHAGSQRGVALVFKGGAAPSQDITARYNWIYDCDEGIHILGAPTNIGIILIEHNLIHTTPSEGTPKTAVNAYTLYLTQDLANGTGQIVHNVTVRNNTWYRTDPVFGDFYLAVGSGPTYPHIHRFWMINNICTSRVFGGTGGTRGTDTLDAEFTYTYWINNNFRVEDANKYTENAKFLNWTYPISIAAIDWKNASGLYKNVADFELNVTSPAYQAGTDGKDVGCDTALIIAALNDSPEA